MKTLKFKDKEEWLAARVGKITGTRIGDIYSSRGSVKKGFWELIAEQLAVPPDYENPMERGLRLQDEAIQRFTKETGKEVSSELIIWQRGDFAQIAVSPDGVIDKKSAVEVKCLSSASHIEAYITKKVPNEYIPQVVQYFVVNDKLEKLYVVFYDPRVTTKDFFYLEIDRKDYADKINEFLEFEKTTLADVSRIVNELSF